MTEPDEKPTVKAKRGLPAHLVPGNPGNSGGKKGRSGRPPKEFKDFCAELARDPRFQKALKTAALNAESRSYGAAVKEILAHGVGLPKQTHELTGKDGAPLIPEAEVVRDRIAGRLARLAAISGTVGAPGEPERN